ncbi:MAG: hypothetical protein E6Q97_14840 [Desulfurellales bacterium]|nr:MAG: hypothetical protein E6Q97_14840 [Desulfurellales bacterium]
MRAGKTMALALALYQQILSVEKKSNIVIAGHGKTIEISVVVREHGLRGRDGHVVLEDHLHLERGSHQGGTGHDGDPPQKTTPQEKI